MIKLSKKLTFVLMIGMTIGLGISLTYVNWKNVSKNIYQQLGMPSICLILSVYFMLYYIRIIKEENRL